jgi:hypothetical protein
MLKRMWVFAWAAFMGAPAFASVPVPGDIVIATGFGDQSTPKFGEFTPTGTLVQSFSVNTPTGTQPVISGATVGPNSQPFVYAGNFSPQLWTFDPSTGTQSTRTTSAWSNTGSLANGALAAYQHYIFATSENAGSSHGGIFRFDLNTGGVVHMFDPNPLFPGGTTSFDKVAIGYNGVLYGLLNQGGFSSQSLVTADPITGDGFTVRTLPEAANAVAADASGNIFVLRGGSNSRGEGIDEFSPSFALLNSLNLPDGTLAGTPTNLDLSATGNLLASSNHGTVLETTTALNAFTTFSVSSTLGAGKTIDYAAAAFVDPPVDAPEPAGLAIGATGFLLLGRRRRNAALG